MLDTIYSWLGTNSGVNAIFGFSVYALFMGWKRVASRWSNWFPLVAKAVRWMFYACAVGVLFLFFQAAGSDLFGPHGLYALAGAAIAPLINLLATLLRPREKLRRGAAVASVAVVNSLVRKKEKPTQFESSFKMGGIDIPRNAEPYHFFVVGSTGSGKSVAITNLIDHLEARGDLALVVDSGGEFCSRYFRAGRDHILNPFDDRCAPWSPTSELEGPWDAESLAKSMVPDGTGDSKEWNSYAQTFVACVLRRLSERGELSIKSLLKYVQGASMEELAPFLAGTPAAAQLMSDKTFGSIRTIASNYLATYGYLQDSEEPFSISKFIRAEKPGFLFLTYRDDQLDSLRNMISCALDIASRTILALPANNERRVWLIIDEFASIGKVQSIEAMATKARKVGGCLLLGLQSVSQLKERYGEHTAQTILSCLSSWMVLRCSDADTSEYISKYIGDAEISRMTRGESSSESGGSDSLNEQIQTQRAVMPVQLQRLDNLKGYFKLSGNYPVCNFGLSLPKKREKLAFNYAARDFNEKPMLSFIEPEQPQLKAPASGRGKLDQQTEELFNSAQDLAEPVVEAAPIFRRRKTALESGPKALETALLSLAMAHEDEL